MYTLEQFTKAWRDSHPQMNVEAEASYYYDIYSKIARLSSLGEEAGVHENLYVMKLMTYIEDMGHLALDKPYQDIYRLAEDDYLSLLESVQFDSWDDFFKALEIVDEAIKNAPESALVERLNEAIVNIDFDGLVQMLKWLFDNSVGLEEVVPRSLKEEYFDELLPDVDKGCLDGIVKLDDIFCWKDKEGYSVVHRLANCLGALGYMESHNNLMALHGNHIDAYRITEVKENGIVIIENIKRTIKGEISLSELPENYKDLYIVDVTVQWDKLYLCEPYMWVPKIDIIRIDFEQSYKDMLESIKSRCCAGDIVLKSGRRVDGRAEMYGKGKAQILSHNMRYNTWLLGINSPGYTEDFWKRYK